MSGNATQLVLPMMCPRRMRAPLRKQARRAAGAPMPVALEFGAHVPDCDVIPHDLSTYDRPRSAS